MCGSTAFVDYHAEGTEEYYCLLASVEERYWKDDGVSGDDGHFRSTFNQSSPAHILKIRRRKPYHGWIANDAKEDLVRLTPAPLPEEFAKLLLMPHAHRKRKKRWDVKPEAS